MLHQVSVARRAGLGSFLQMRADAFRSQMKSAAEYSEAVRTRAGLDPPQTRFHSGPSIAGAIALFEAYLSDITLEFLECCPGSLSDKNAPLKEIGSVGSILGFIRSVAAGEVRKVAYGRFPEMLEWTLHLFNKDATLPDGIVDDVNEMKCTRDVFIHNGGISNSIYVERTKGLARAKAGDPLPLDWDYLQNSIKRILALEQMFFAMGPTRFADYGRVRAFREMWESTCLARQVAFEIAWRVGKNDMIYPREFEWTWSSSESALYDFFLGVFNPEDPNRRTEITAALRRWPAASSEGTVIRAWIEAPFWF